MIDAQQREIEELRRMQQSLKPCATMHDDHDGMMKGEIDSTSRSPADDVG